MNHNKYTMEAEIQWGQRLGAWKHMLGCWLSGLFHSPPPPKIINTVSLNFLSQH